jgi:hypothetical protein
MGQQIGEPGGIVDVALAAGNVANVHSVGEDQFHACLKDMPRGFPILARGFHRHVGAAVGGESVAEPARSIREEGHSCALWQGLLGRPASESGSLRDGDGGPARGDRRRRGLLLAILLRREKKVAPEGATFSSAYRSVVS